MFVRLAFNELGWGGGGEGDICSDVFWFNLNEALFDQNFVVNLDECYGVSKKSLSHVEICFPTMTTNKHAFQGSRNILPNWYILWLFSLLSYIIHFLNMYV